MSMMLPDPGLVFSGNHEVESGRRNTELAMTLPSSPGAAFADGAQLATRALFALGGLPFATRRRATAASCDETEQMRSTDPPLIIVDGDIEAIGRQAAQHLLRMLDEVECGSMEMIAVPMRNTSEATVA